LSAKLFNIGDQYDRVIATKFPAHYIKHDNKVLWLFHQFRQAYDLYGTEYSDLQQSKEGKYLKEVVTNADNQYLPEAKKIFSISPIVQKRLKEFNNIDSEVLFTAASDSEKFFFKEYGDFIFYPSRISRSKRQLLAVEAMRYTKSNVKLVLAGKGDSIEDEIELVNLIEQYDLTSKVTYMRGFISEEKKIELFAECLGGVYLPYMEDSYGFPTLEAYYSKKPVITVTDAGGTDVIVHQNISGLVTAPNAKQLAHAMDTLYNNRETARKLGHGGFDVINKLGIYWDNIVNKLTADYSSS
ncbi:MAG TPA: glycosyltransferase, partial [Alphaproteobacteria bacterium]|nr:glycosyltransferase [Alphaproteobacteria bacterium]